MTPGFSAQDKVREGLTAALDRKAAAVLVFNLTDLTTMADYFVLSTANSDRQARAIADAISEKLGSPLSVEGKESARWILLDYGDVVFHVFQEEARRFYALERLWGDAQNDTSQFLAAARVFRRGPLPKSGLPAACARIGETDQRLSNRRGIARSPGRSTRSSAPRTCPRRS